MSSYEFTLVEQVASQISELIKLSRRDLGKFYLVVAKNVGEPVVYTFDTIEQCAAKIVELKGEVSSSPVYTYVFQGARWSLTKHPSRGLRCGEEFVPLPLADIHGVPNGETTDLAEL